VTVLLLILSGLQPRNISRRPTAAKLTSDYVPVTMSTLCKKEAALSQGNRVMSQVF